MNKTLVFEPYIYPKHFSIILIYNKIKWKQDVYVVKDIINNNLMRVVIFIIYTRE